MGAPKSEEAPRTASEQERDPQRRK